MRVPQPEVSDPAHLAEGGHGAVACEMISNKIQDN